MAIKKCLRCELNYILDDAPVCTVCSREMKGEQSRGSVLEPCSICNENPSLPGKDMCLFCLKEMESGADTPTNDTEEETEAFEGKLKIEDASEMEEIDMDTGDIPRSELGEIDRELSLEDVLDEEEAEDDEELAEDM